MLETSPAVISQLQLTSDGCQLRFFHDLDRLGHIITDTRGVALIRSVELSHDQEHNLAPASPVFQEVHEESLPQGLSLMTVGQWGKIHFSSVFLAAKPDSLTCQIAARVRNAEPVHLASTYTLNRTTSDLISADASEIICQLEGNRQLIIRAGTHSQLSITPAGLAALRLQIMPAETDAGPSKSGSLARTVQWSYTFELVS